MKPLLKLHTIALIALLLNNGLALADTSPLAASCQQTDNTLAPTMVAIRPGSFLMGSPKDEQGRYDDESPQHPVTLPKPYAISRCEITVGQFRQFVQDTAYKTTAETTGNGCYSWDAAKKDWQETAGNSWQAPGFSQTDLHPVVCVSWQDAQQYLDWLSQRTGVAYRLPTEAEWEYAARADTQTPRYFVESEQNCYANGLGKEAKVIADKSWTLTSCDDGFVYTAPVASFAANPFGLFDMLGNALEWTLDCYHENYNNAPNDGSAWLAANSGECGHRVVRGGSWNYLPQLRSAYRSRYDAVGAGNFLGFRVARAL